MKRPVKGLETQFKWHSVCLANVRPWVQISVPESKPNQNIQEKAFIRPNSATPKGSTGGFLLSDLKSELDTLLM
jgi:hypothetical protein